MGIPILLDPLLPWRVTYEKKPSFWIFIQLVKIMQIQALGELRETQAMHKSKEELNKFLEPNNGIESIPGKSWRKTANSRVK